MYICDNCGVRFDEPKIVEEKQYHSEVGCTEELAFAVCPCCGYDHFSACYEEEDGDEDED